MIISASRRTDIPAFYSEWFLNRIKAGHLMTRNPYNQTTRKVSLTPNSVNAIVFWTKNPQPMLHRLDELRNFMYYFQFTVSAYGTDIEPHVPNKQGVILPAFKQLADTIGPERVIWRYDPILITDRYDTAYHLHAFNFIANALRGYTKKVIISFVDVDYKNTKRLALPVQNINTQVELAKKLADIARSCGMEIETCAEDMGLEQFGINHARCIDGDLISKLLNRQLGAKKDKWQRKTCGCVTSIDIGAYNTCLNGCTYCYANFQPDAIQSNYAQHDPASSFLIG